MESAPTGNQAGGCDEWLQRLRQYPAMQQELVNNKHGRALFILYIYVCVTFKCICLLLRWHVARRVDCGSLSTSADGGVYVDVDFGVSGVKYGNAEVAMRQVFTD